MKKIIFILLLLLVCVPIAYYFNMPTDEKELAVINPIDLNSEMVDVELRTKGKDHYIADFDLINQEGEAFSSSSVSKKIWVVEYFFASCMGICPIMNEQMKRIQSAYYSDTNVVILSFTVDPENDTPKVLKEYANAHESVAGKWFFLTGNKESIYKLARKSFFLLKPAEAKNQGDVGSDFIHTNNFVLIDENKQIRGYYDGTNRNEVDELIDDIAILQKE